MSLSFIYPLFLWLLLILPIVIGIALLSETKHTRDVNISPSDRIFRIRFSNRLRFWIALAIRCIIFILLIFALAGIQINIHSNIMTTVFVLDASDSISPDQRQVGEALIRAAIEQKGKSDQAAVIVFGEDALVERLSDLTDPSLAKIASIPITTRTNIADALQLAQAIFPGEGAKRIVLLSDGRENLGKAIEQADLAAASQIELTYIPLGADSSAIEVWIDSLQAPTEIRLGQDFELEAVIESSTSLNASLRLFEEGNLIQTLELHLLPGSNQVSLPISAGDQHTSTNGSLRRFRLQIIPDADTRLQNNEASSFTIVQGPPAVLIVEGVMGDGDNLAHALRSALMKVTLISPFEMPSTLEELAHYESIILTNVQADALPPGVMEILQIYVRDLGKGLLMVGGPKSFGAGGYLRTPLEESLPVDMDVRDKDIQSNLALVLAVDKSGSMGRCHCDNPDLNQTYTPTLSGQPKVDIAKEAVMRAAAALGDQDQLGVIAFDSQPRWAVELGSPPDPFALERSISAIQADGQTNLQAGITAAYQALQSVEARRKHIILMTDGWVRTGDLTNIAQEMQASGVTLSIVAAGEGSAEYMRSLASLGGGEFYPAVDIQSVPDIFLKETIKSAGKYIVEEPFLPLPASPSPILRGLDASNLPPLFGYNGTSSKKTARLDLITPRGDPLLASWQYGLGRAAVWTSDLRGQWAIEWLGWNGFSRFVSQLVAWSLPSPQSEGLSVHASLTDNQALIQVSAIRKDGNPYNFLTGSVTLINPNLEVSELSLKQVGAGQYQIQTSVSTPGVYLVRVGINDGDQSLGQSTLGLVVPYSPEYKTNGVDHGFLTRLASLTGGAELNSSHPSAAFEHNLPSIPAANQIWLPLLILAALLFPFDVAIRRLFVNKKDLLQAANWFKSLLFFCQRTSGTADPALHVPRLLSNLYDARQRARHRQVNSSQQPPPNQNASNPSTPQPQVPPSSQERSTPTSPLDPDQDSIARLRAAKKRRRR